MAVLGAVSSARIGSTLPLLGLTALVWLLAEWLRFTLTTSSAFRNLRVERQVRDDHSAVDTLWAGRTFEVRLTLHLSGLGRWPFALVEDRPPAGAEAAGDTGWGVGLAAGGPAAVRSRSRWGRRGQVRFGGVRVRLAAPQGFFYRDEFVRRPAVLAVLPPMTDAETSRRTDKRHNVLPAPGVHR